MNKEEQAKQEIKRLLQELASAEPHIYLNSQAELKRQSRKKFSNAIVKAFLS